jgi:hypothetical protein
MLDAVQGRLDHFALLLQHMDGMVGLVGVRIMLLKLIEQPATLAKEFRLVDGAARRNGKSQQDTGNSCVHTRVEHRSPYADPDQCIDHGIANAQPIGAKRNSNAYKSQAQRDQRNMLGVKQRDDQHAKDIVHNGQRGNKDLQPRRYPAAQQRQHA